MTDALPLQAPSRLPGLAVAVGLHVAVVVAVIAWRKPTAPERPPKPVEVAVIAELPPPPPPPEPPAKPTPKPTPPPPPPVTRAAPPPPVRPAPPPEPRPVPVPQVASPPAPAPVAPPVEAPAPAAPAVPVASTAPTPAPAPPRTATPAAVAVVCPNYQKAMGDAAFPRDALRMGLEQGDALIEFTVAANGEVKNVRAVRASNSVFGRAGVRLVSSYVCVGQGQDVLVQVPIGFKLAP